LKQNDDKWDDHLIKGRVDEEDDKAWEVWKTLCLQLRKAV